MKPHSGKGKTVSYEVHKDALRQPDVQCCSYDRNSCCMTLYILVY